MSQLDEPDNLAAEQSLDCQVARRIGEVLPAFMKVVRQWITQAGLPQGLTLPQILLLRAIDEGGDVQPRDMARHFLLSPASITSAVDGLVLKGLVDRRHDEQDRRTVRLCLTDAGRRIVTEAEAGMVATVRDLVAGLPADRHERLLLALADLELITKYYREGDLHFGCAVRPTEDA